MEHVYKIRVEVVLGLFKIRFEIHLSDTNSSKQSKFWSYVMPEFQKASLTELLLLRQNLMHSSYVN